MSSQVSVPTLHHVPWYSSSTPYYVALELGLTDSQFQVKEYTIDQIRKEDDFVKISPRRMVPVMQFPDNTIMLESGAIVMHLLEKYDSQGKLHPLPGHPDRTKFLQLVFYTLTECLPLSNQLFDAIHSIPKEKQDPSKIQNITNKIKTVLFEHLKLELDDGKKDYYLGNEWSIADAMLAYPLLCVQYSMPNLIEENELVSKYSNRLAQRPMYQKLFKHEHCQYNETQEGHVC